MSHQQKPYANFLRATRGACNPNLNVAFITPITRIWTLDHVKLTHSSSNANRACQLGTFPVQCEVRLERVVICSRPSGVRASSNLFVLYLKRGARVLFVLDLKSV